MDRKVRAQKDTLDLVLNQKVGKSLGYFKMYKIMHNHLKENLHKNNIFCLFFTRSQTLKK